MKGRPHQRSRTLVKHRYPSQTGVHTTHHEGALIPVLTLRHCVSCAEPRYRYLFTPNLSELIRCIHKASRRPVDWCHSVQRRSSHRLITDFLSLILKPSFPSSPPVWFLMNAPAPQPFTPPPSSSSLVVLLIVYPGNLEPNGLLLLLPLLLIFTFL